MNCGRAHMSRSARARRSIENVSRETFVRGTCGARLRERHARTTNANDGCERLEPSENAASKRERPAPSASVVSMQPASMRSGHERQAQVTHVASRQGNERGKRRLYFHSMRRSPSRDSTHALCTQPSLTSIFAMQRGKPPRGRNAEPGHSRISAGLTSLPTTISGTCVCPWMHALLFRAP